MSTRRAVLALCLFPLVAAGCGESAKPRPKAVPFSAKVTGPGGPVKSVYVQFIPTTAQQLQIQFPTDDAGALQPNRAGETLEIIPGKYSVKFFPYPGKSKADEEKSKATIKALPGKYTSDTGESDLQVEVKPDGSNDLTITVSG